MAYKQLTLSERFVLALLVCIAIGVPSYFILSALHLSFLIEKIIKGIFVGSVLYVVLNPPSEMPLTRSISNQNKRDLIIVLSVCTIVIAGVTATQYYILHDQFGIWRTITLTISVLLSVIACLVAQYYYQQHFQLPPHTNTTPS